VKNMKISSDTSKRRSKRILQGLRDEICAGYAAGPNSLLRHAMRLVIGEARSERESVASWKDDYFIDPDHTIYPIKNTVGSRLDQCYYGHADAAAIARFENQSATAFTSRPRAAATPAAYHHHACSVAHQLVYCDFRCIDSSFVCYAEKRRRIDSTRSSRPRAAAGLRGEPGAVSCASTVAIATCGNDLAERLANRSASTSPRPWVLHGKCAKRSAQGQTNDRIVPGWPAVAAASTMSMSACPTRNSSSSTPLVA